MGSYPPSPLCAAPYRRMANGVSSTSGGRCRSEGPRRENCPALLPASRPQAAKLPSLPAPIAGTPHRDDETPLGFLSAVPVVRCAIPKDGERSFVPPGGRCRSAGPRRENCPALLPASRPQARSAGLQTGIAAAGRETPVATCAHSRNPTPGRRNAPWVPIRRPRCALRHTEGWRREFRPPRGTMPVCRAPPGELPSAPTGAPASATLCSSSARRKP